MTTKHRKKTRPRQEPIAKFVCPYCGYETVSRVLATRGARRRRMCTECQDYYPTIELVVARRRRPGMHRPKTKMPLLPFDE